MLGLGAKYKTEGMEEFRQKKRRRRGRRRGGGGAVWEAEDVREAALCSTLLPKHDVVSVTSWEASHPDRPLSDDVEPSVLNLEFVSCRGTGHIHCLLFQMFPYGFPIKYSDFLSALVYMTESFLSLCSIFWGDLALKASPSSQRSGVYQGVTGDEWKAEAAWHHLQLSDVCNRQE